MQGPAATDRRVAFAKRPLFPEGYPDQGNQYVGRARGDRDSAKQFSEWEHHWLFEVRALDDERKRKLADFEGWWQVHGAEHHQFRRFWTANCRWN
jgi:hypothetical protein